jgi:WD40 repeat protein
VIALAAAVVACFGAAAAVAVPRLTGNTTSPGSPRPSADPALFGQAGTFTPPTTAGSWQEVTSVAFSPDGKSLAVGLTTDSTNSYNPNTFDGKIYMFNVAGGSMESTYMLVAGGTVTFSADGHLLAASGGTGQRLVYLVNSASGKGAALPFIPGAGGEPIKTLAFSPNGRLLAADDTSGGFSLWSTVTRRPIGTEISGQSASSAIAFSPDGRTIAVGGAGSISLWNTGIGSIMASIHVPGGGLVGPMAYSPDGGLLAAALPDGRIGLWNAATHLRLGMLQGSGGEGVTAVAISPDSQMLAAGDVNGKTYLWDLRTGKLITSLTNPTGSVPPGLNAQSQHAVDSVAFSPDGNTLATSDTNGSAYLWRVR